MGDTKKTFLWFAVIAALVLAVSQFAMNAGIKNPKMPNIYSPAGKPNMPQDRMVKVLRDERDEVVDGVVVLTKKAAQPVNPFSLAATDGTVADSSGFKGRVTLLYLWGMHSRDSMMGLPMVETAALKYAARGLKVYGLAFKTAPEEFNSYFSKNPPAFPSALVGRESPVPVSFIPATMIVDKDGLVRVYCNSPVESGTLEKLIEKMLNEAPAAGAPEAPPPAGK